MFQSIEFVSIYSEHPSFTTKQNKTDTQQFDIYELSLMILKYAK